MVLLSLCDIVRTFQYWRKLFIFVLFFAFYIDRENILIVPLISFHGFTGDLAFIANCLDYMFYMYNYYCHFL